MTSTHSVSAPATKHTLPDVGESEASTSNKNKSKKRKTHARLRRYNLFNIFFMLERQLLLQARGGGINAIKDPIDTTNSPLPRHKELKLLPLCQRYKHLPLTSNWFAELIQHHRKKRKHTKTHGILPFRELAKTVAKNYREIDDDTHKFLKEVLKRLRRHLDESDAIDAKDEIEAIQREISGDTAGAVRGCQKTKGLSQDEAVKVQQLMGTKTQMISSSSPHTVHNHLTSSSYHVSQDIYLLEGRPSSGNSVYSEHERSQIERPFVAGRPSFAEKKAAHSRTNQQHAVEGDWKKLDSGHLQNEMPCRATDPSAHPPAADADACRHPASTANSNAHSKMKKADPELERLRNDLKGEIAARYDVDRRIDLLKAQIMARAQILKLKRQIDVADVQVRSPPVTVATQQKPQYPAILESSSTAPSQPSSTPRYYPNAAHALTYPDAKPNSEHPMSTLDLEMTRPTGFANPSTLREIERTLIDEATSQAAVIDVDSCFTLLKTLLARVGGGEGVASTLTARHVASLINSLGQRTGFQAQSHMDKGGLIEKQRQFTSKKLDLRTNPCNEEKDDREEIELEWDVCRNSEDIPDVAISTAEANASLDNPSVAAVTTHPPFSSDPEPVFCKGDNKEEIGEVEAHGGRMTKIVNLDTIISEAKFLATAVAAQLKSLPPTTHTHTVTDMPRASETEDTTDYSDQS